MNKENIKKILKTKNEVYIVKIKLLTKTYIQSIKIEKYKIHYNYYEIKDNKLIEIKNEKVLNYLIDNYELKPNPVVYLEDKAINDEFKLKYKIQKINSNEQNNPYLETWCQKFISDKLDNCKSFSKVFGKEFAKRKVKDLKIYIKERLNENCVGQCSLDGVIDILLSTKNDEYYSISSLMEDEAILAVILHEGTHGVLRARNGYTGIMMQLDSNNGKIKHDKYSELGRAFNEGLTEWIVEKSGLGGHVGFEYLIYLRMVKLIELAIGEERVMLTLKESPLQTINKQKLKHIQKMLKMTKYDIIYLLTYTDIIYNLFLEANEIVDKIGTLEKFKNIDSIQDKTKRKEIEIKYKEIKRSMSLIEKEDYEEFLDERNLEKSDENLKLYYRGLIKAKKGMVRELQSECDSIIFEIYFEKDFNKVFKKEQISQKEMIKYSKVYSLINLNMEQEDTSIEFARKYEKLKERYISSITEQMKQKYQNGNLKLSDLTKLLDWGEINFNDKLDIMHSDFVYQVIENYANIISTKYAKHIQKITESLYRKNDLQELDGCSIKVINRNKWRRYSNIL